MKQTNLPNPFHGYPTLLEKLSDEERHQLIDKAYSDTHQFTARDIISLLGKLKFNSEKEFFEWLKAEQKKYAGVSHHNFIRVESWYMNTFAHLIRAVNANFGNPVGEVESTVVIF